MMNHGNTNAGALHNLPDLAFDLDEGSVRPAPLGKTDVPIAVLPELSRDLRRHAEALGTADLARACRIFMDLAYPDGAATIPDSKRAYYSISPDSSLDEFVPPAKAALAVCQLLPRRVEAGHGYAFRLGSAAYPHLKLCVQPVPHHDRAVWVYSVDTHDGGPQLAKLSPADAGQWRAMLDQNRALKKAIEHELALAGFLTPNNLLQLDLIAPAPPV